MQPDLFGGGPEGLLYRPDFIGEAEEQELAQRIAALPLEPFAFHGFLGRRRVASFGWRYRFDGSGLAEAAPIPDYLTGLRARAAALAQVEAEALVQVLISEYEAGAGIGWHRDRPVFGDVIGISLLAPARLRFRRGGAGSWERSEVNAAPRSLYLLRGPARWEWEHSIPAMDRLRYSITFRSLVPRAQASRRPGRAGDRSPTRS